MGCEGWGVLGEGCGVLGRESDPGCAVGFSVGQQLSGVRGLVEEELVALCRQR